MINRNIHLFNLINLIFIYLRLNSQRYKKRIFSMILHIHACTSHSFLLEFKVLGLFTLHCICILNILKLKFTSLRNFMIYFKLPLMNTINYTIKLTEWANWGLNYFINVVIYCDVDVSLSNLYQNASSGKYLLEWFRLDLD